MSNTQDNNAQKLLAKIEQVNGKWDKVTVRIPNSTYTLNEVKFQNGLLSVTFVYTDSSTNEPVNFAFMLSAFIDINSVSADDKFVVETIDGNTQTNSNQPSAMSAVDEEDLQSVSDFKCPPKCPF